MEAVARKLRARKVVSVLPKFGGGANDSTQFVHKVVRIVPKVGGHILPKVGGVARCRASVRSQSCEQGEVPTVVFACAKRSAKLMPSWCKVSST